MEINFSSDRVYNDFGERMTLWTWKWLEFFKRLWISMYYTGGQSEPEKKKIKATLGPPLLPIKYPHKTPPLSNLEGGGGGREVRTLGLPSESAHEALYLLESCVNTGGWYPSINSIQPSLRPGFLG